MLFSHHHFAHTRDLIILGANVDSWRGQVDVHALQHTLDVLISCLLDGKKYVNSLEYPDKKKPALLLSAIEPYTESNHWEIRDFTTASKAFRAYSWLSGYLFGGKSSFLYW